MLAKVLRDTGCTQAVLRNKYTWACQLNFPHNPSWVGHMHTETFSIVLTFHTRRPLPSRLRLLFWKLWPKTSKTLQRSQEEVSLQIYNKSVLPFTLLAGPSPAFWP